jgi:hypothetical protein
MNKRIKVVNVGGQNRRIVQATPEEIEFLKVMQESQAWRIYQDILYAQRDEALFGLMIGEVDKEKYSKTIGKAEGLHSAAIHLDLLMRTDKQQAERVAEGSINQP